MCAELRFQQSRRLVRLAILEQMLGIEDDAQAVDLERGRGCPAVFIPDVFSADVIMAAAGGVADTSSQFAFLRELLKASSPSMERQ